MKPTFIGLAKCSRCGGGDPNCPVCNTPTREELAERKLSERRAFFARRRATQSGKKTSQPPVQ